MPTHRVSSVTSGPPAGAKDVLAPLRTASDAFEHLVGGLGTAVLALVALVWTIAVTLACLVGVGLLLVPGTLRLLRAVADRERARLSGWGDEITRPSPGPESVRAAAADPTTRRELCWLVVHGTLGLLVGLVGVTLPLAAATDVLFPVWWRLVPPSRATPSPVDFGPVQSWPGAFAVCLAGVGMIAVVVGSASWTARLQAWPGRRLLPSRSMTDLSLRVAELTATRAAALDAHAVELRRIERSLHDGTQNRLVAVGILIGAARRALARDPSRADDVLERAQSAAEQALAELRTVVRGILPPVLTDRSLADALTGLAAACPVSCRIDADDTQRYPASVEATAYFVAAEALTNIARHSAARSATVTMLCRADRLCLTITDDGRGGADEQGGSGLTGIRHRAEAHDGTFTLDSPLGGPTTMEVGLPCGW